MAPPNRRNAPDLTAQLKSAPQEFGFFQAVRLMILAGPERDGSLPPGIRFRTPATLAFPPSELAAWGAHPADPRLEEVTVSFLGLTGPMGVLPASYTEWLMERRWLHRDGAAHAFLDLFVHRILLLFYEAWRKGRFHFHWEQARKGGLFRQALALLGLPAHRTLSQAAASPGTAPCPRTLIPLAGILARHPLPASCLEGILGAVFRTPIRVQSFRGRWMPIPLEEGSRLGRGSSCLGRETFLGARQWDRQTKVQILAGPIPSGSFSSFLPGGAAFRDLGQWVSRTQGPGLAWDLALQPSTGALPRPFLGSPALRLGFDSFLRTRERTTLARPIRFRLQP
jgi:type VI secretion system protein ImpH